MRNDLIRAILNCGVDDLSMLDDSEADMFEIVEHMRSEGLELTLNEIMGEVFREGIHRLNVVTVEGLLGKGNLFDLLRCIHRLVLSVCGRVRCVQRLRDYT